MKHWKKWIWLAALVLLAAPPAEDRFNLLTYLDGNGNLRQVRSRKDWGVRRSHIVANLERVMGKLPAGPAPTVEVQVFEEERLPLYVRKKIAYRSEGNDFVPAYLLIPHGRGKRLPAVVCLHQTTRIGKGEPAGIGGKPDLHYARELAERGYVAIAPDYPNFGDYRFDPYANGYSSATMKGIWNHMRAVDVLETLPEVDSKRIGAIGHSLGGHNTLFLGVFDQRVKAMVTSCGFNSFRKYMRGDLTGWSHKGYMPRIASDYGKDPDRVPFDFTEILGALAPRAVFVNAPIGDANFEVSGVKDCEAAARPVYDRVFHKPDRLVVVYPEAKHEFPRATREQAYRFLDRWLKR